MRKNRDDTPQDTPPDTRQPVPRWALAGVALMAIANLLAALGGGLVRLQTVPLLGAGPTGPQAVTAHGALMMAGFFGSLIALERVVALRRGLWVPALAALGGWLAWGPGWWRAAEAAWFVSALGLAGLYAWAARRRAMSLPLAVEASGALALALGTLGQALMQPMLARLGWSAFLVLTIAGERRELMRLVRLPAWSARAFLIGWAGVLLCLLLSLLLASLPLASALWHGSARPDPSVVMPLWWALMAALALWLLRFDIATRMTRAAGWAGHTAICLTVGYGWLLLAAMLGLAGWAVAWHVLWLGFVMAMVFGHAPIMLPALAGWRPEPTRWALLPLALLGLSLALRIAAATTPTDWGLSAAQPWAGAGHAVALLSFGAVMVRAVRRGQ